MTLVDRFEVSRCIRVPPAIIFEFLCTPQGHVAIDSSGSLMSANGEPVRKGGDTFVVHMDREALHDLDLGLYDVTVTITSYEKDRRLEWKVSDAWTHVYGYLLAPIEGGTEVTSYYDWSSIDQEWKDSGVFPVLTERALRATLGILDRTLAPRS